MSMGLIALLTAALAAVLAGGATVLFGKKNPLVRMIVAAVLAFAVEFGLLYAFMPAFAHWTRGGVPMSLLVAGGVSLVVVGLADFIASNESYDSNGNASIGLGFMLFVLFIGWIIMMVIHPPLPAWMDNQVWDRMAGLLDVRDATEADLQESSTDDDLLKVHPAGALLQARGVMPGNVGTYAEVNGTFEQSVNGEPVYITDLRVTNWRGYREAGAALPGYMMRPAREVGGQTRFVSGYRIVYAPDARWSYDLERHVYRNFVLGCGCFVDNLDVLEVDDNGKPWYTATTYDYVIGNIGTEATGVIVVDPETGDITEYDIDEIPQWIDRVYSMDVIQERVDWWATYSEWDARFMVPSTLGKMRIDAGQDVYGHDGRLWYSFTITSAGSDQTLISEIRVDPKTGEAVKFPATGKTIESVVALVAAESKTDAVSTLGATPVECERQDLLGTPTYYCILETLNEGSGAAAGSIQGYAFLNERFTSDPDKVVVAGSFDEAWRLYRRQLTQAGGSSEQVQGEGAETIVFQGQVVRMSPWPIEETTVWLVVENEEYPNGVYFTASADDPMVALIEEGDIVVITAYDLRVDAANDAVQIVNESLPALTE